jgi:hypothetical protein
MAKWLSIVLLCAGGLNAAMSSATAPENPVIPVRSTGGPDDYGYTWIDSDEAGGPEYNWVDITGIGTQVEGLDDDNVIGPFQIGFEFPFYWYRATRFWVCSNGLISFSSNGLWTSHQGGSVIPQSAPPNDLVLPLAGDLDFGHGRGEVYYYSNGVDSLVVSFLDVPEWNNNTDTTGSHTFQLILYAVDSTITFHYGPQRGTFDYGHPQAPPSNGIGIENISGEVGLQYLLDNLPTENMYEDSLAILFVPPESTTFEVTDMAMVEAGSEGNLGFFLCPNNPYEPFAHVKNTGNQEVTDYSAYCQIMRFNGPTVYLDTLTGGPIQPSEEDTLTFDTWIPDEEGWYDFRSWVVTTGDPVHFNDSSRIDMRVVVGETWLWFMNDTLAVNLTYWFGSGSGWGGRFTPPNYPTVIETVQVMMALTAGASRDEAELYLYDDDGMGGLPGTVLASDTVDVQSPTPIWYNLIPDEPIEVEDGSFYVGMIQGATEGPGMALCTVPPFARQTLENTGAWSTYRDAETADIAMRVKAYVPAAIEEETSSGPVRPEIRLIGNPVRASLSLRFEIERGERVSLDLFDATGRRVGSHDLGELRPGMHQSSVSVSSLPGGVYFARIQGETGTLCIERFVRVE